MGVGDDQAVTRPDEARARGARRELLDMAAAPAPEKLGERVVGHDLLAVDRHVDRDDRGATRLTALMIRSWSLPPPVSGGRAQVGGRIARAATPAKCVLAKSIIGSCRPSRRRARPWRSRVSEKLHILFLSVGGVGFTPSLLGFRARSQSRASFSRILIGRKRRRGGIVPRRGLIGHDRPSFIRMMRLAWRATSSSWVTMMIVRPPALTLAKRP